MYNNKAKDAQWARKETAKFIINNPQYSISSGRGDIIDGNTEIFIRHIKSDYPRVFLEREPTPILHPNQLPWMLTLDIHKGDKVIFKMPTWSERYDLFKLRNWYLSLLLADDGQEILSTLGRWYPGNRYNGSGWNINKEDLSRFIS